WQLPRDSIYLPIEPEYLRRTKHSQEVGMPTEKYAKSVVSQVLGGRHKRQIWEGAFSWAVWFVNSFLPASIFDYLFWRNFGMWKLREAHTKKLA
ncbi:hypothetical protein KCU77_g15342, partial [Aureobasidium melanogenum]